MNDTTPRRGWLRFNLRGLLLLVTMFGGWFAYELNWIRQRRAFIAEEEDIRNPVEQHWGITFQRDSKVPSIAPSGLWLFGEPGYSTIQFVAEGPVGTLTGKDLERVRAAERLFPEAEIHIGSTSRDSRQAFEEQSP